MTAPVPPSSFAELAVELKVAQSTGHVDLADLVHATWLQSHYAGDRLARLDILSASIGLPEHVTAGILASERKHAACIAEAHQLLKALIPHEAEVRRLLADVPPRTVWQRLVDFIRGTRP